MFKNKWALSLALVALIAGLTTTGAFAKGNLPADQETAAYGIFMPPPPGDFQLSDEALAAAAEALGITTDELSAALDAGTTFDELATTYGVDVKTVLDAIRAVMPAPANDNFANGQPPMNGGQPGQMQLSDEALAAAAGVLGITTDELSTALAAGTRLDELATTYGVDAQDVFDAINAVQPMPQGAPNGQGGQPGQMQLSDEALAAAAGVLGITTDELSTALAAGTTFDELATTYGVDVQTIFDAINTVQPMPQGGPNGQDGQMPGGQNGQQPGQGQGGPNGTPPNGQAPGTRP
ncbi:MAG: hypothetical protein U0X74_05895 [Anaerolineales bacterium]